ncbi:MAG: TIGR04219 family outer membrane beta-barrel protein [Sulfuricurvum sp.]|uniref:TIGR04219 family outer membrane beta-barrel protein n=1 Tax=Sulfuricurvum sp. TaxID=2025608 RepID=UPI002618F149|nr:TIGR04219 family outer membrane beta-barrel protein [Sulfuricurvum sp.]MDD2828143.1 TIGR04219 family outer membrane beta-barrel protein [Sulfuricurvum sp.]MDD4949902.1 TIGR04219 family outer membrane beta-barrel protein [Sulfuricurvum sp.]
MKKALLVLCTGSVMASASMLLGFGAEVDGYLPEVNGNFSYTDNGVTTTTRFNGDSTSKYQLGLYFEHPVPVIPNIRVDFTPETSFVGDNVGGLGTNAVKFSQIDTTLYYEILDNIVDLDVGLTGKIFKGDVSGAVNQSFNVVLPMGYLGAAVKIPTLPIRFEGDVKYAEYSGNSIRDMRIKAAWEVFAGLEAVAGYRSETLDINEKDIVSNITIKGPFVGIGYRF